MIIIRLESAEHETGVRVVEERAFWRADEADLVDKLRARGAVTLSLIAVEAGEVVESAKVIGRFSFTVQRCF